MPLNVYECDFGLGEGLNVIDMEYAYIPNEHVLTLSISLGITQLETYLRVS